MKTKKTIQKKFTFLKWIGILSLLFSFSGYSNYTAPISRETTIELVVSQQKKSSKERSVFFRLKKEKTISVLYFSDLKTEYLIAYHAKQNLVEGNKNAFFISTHKKLVLKHVHNSSYLSEEDPSFHLGS